MNQGITYEISKDIHTEWIKIMDASTRDLPSTSDKIIEYLRDKSSQQTSDYILRRFIQNRFPEYVKEAEEKTGKLCEDLSSNKNLPWNTKCVDIISEKLFKNVYWDEDLMKNIARNVDERVPSKIKKKQWITYLSEHRSIQRKQLFNIALSLGMDTENTQKLLMACGAEPYNLHNVFDVICLYCQKNSDKKTYMHAWELYARYLEMEKECTKNMKQDIGIPYGMTSMIQKHISFGNDDVSFVEGLMEQKEAFCGYSTRQWSGYHQFARFLAVLYPEYEYRYVYYETRKPDSRGRQCEPIEEELAKMVPFEPMNLLIETADGLNRTLQEKSVPNLNKLLTAMFSQATWFSGNNGSKDKLKGAAKVQKDVPGLIHTFCDTYKDRCKRIHCFKAPVEREDVLLFSFFFIAYYLYEPDTGREVIKCDLKELTTDGTVLEAAVWNVISELDSRRNIREERFDTIVRCLNSFLNSFGFVEVYLPNPFDRFIVLALLSDAPMSVSSEILDSIRYEREEGLMENKGDQGK